MSQEPGKIPGRIPVYLEIGKKRVFAVAVEWPGWCRIGRDSGSALQALLDYGARYARVLRAADLSFRAPAALPALTVIEQLEGTPTTDFGAPDAIPTADLAPLDEHDLRRLAAVLDACWSAFAEAREAAAGHELRKGPRGGGRDLDGITRHVLGAEQAYLSRLGRKLKLDESLSLEERMDQIRTVALEALAAGEHGELPSQGPRGGKIWPVRYYARRSAWHLLDHAWEIEDKVL